MNPEDFVRRIAALVDARLGMPPDAHRTASTDESPGIAMAADVVTFTEAETRELASILAPYYPEGDKLNQALASLGVGLDSFVGGESAYSSALPFELHSLDIERRVASAKRRV